MLRVIKSVLRRGLATAALGAALVVSAPTPNALACVDPPPPPPIWVEFLSPTEAIICIHDYRTFGAGPGSFCACALNQVGPIVDVKWVVIVNKLDGLPIPGWEFVANPNTSAGFGKVAPGNWAGFHGEVIQPVFPDIPVNIKFRVNLLPGSTPQDLLDAIDSGEPIIGSDEADPQGNLTGGHLGINPSGGSGAMPPNDQCFDRFLLPGDGSYQFNNIGAVQDGPLPSCGGTMGSDVWFNYVADTDGTLVVNTCGSQFDTVLAVYDNCNCPVDPAREVGCNDDFCGLQSQVTVNVVAGGCYKIQVGGFQGGQGFGVINVECIPSTGGPPNDLCGDRLMLPGDGVYTFDNFGATTDGPPNCALSGLAGSDVWFNYLATTDGTLTVSTCGSGFDTVLSVYDACACPVTAASLVACNDDSDCDGVPGNELQSTVSVPAAAGACYKIQVSGWNSQQGQGVLDVRCVADPPTGDPDLVRARSKLIDTIQQLQDTQVQLGDAIQQIQNARVLDDQCMDCADAADAELERAEMKLADTIQQLDETIFQLEKSIFLLDQAIQLLNDGAPDDAVVPLLNQVLMNLQRANEKLDRAIQKLDGAIQQLINAEQLLAMCGTCADAALQEISRAIAKLDRAIDKLIRAIDKINGAFDQVKRVRDRLACPADTNGDRTVDVNDLVNVITLWGTPGQAPGVNADVNRDGTVDVNDLVRIITAWGPCPQPEG